MNSNIRITPDGPEDELTTETADVHIARVFQPRGKTRVAIESAFARKDDIKALDYDTTGRKWDKGAKVWTAHLTHLNPIIRHFQDRGVTVTVAFDVVDTFENDYHGGRTFLPEHR